MGLINISRLFIRRTDPASQELKIYPPEIRGKTAITSPGAMRRSVGHCRKPRLFKVMIMSSAP
jgi:hypothetical protein